MGKEENVIMVSVVPMGSGEGDEVNPEKLRGIVKEEMVRQNASGVILVNRVNDEIIQNAQNLGQEQQNAGRTTNNEIKHDPTVEPEHRQNGSGQMMPAGEAGHMSQGNTHSEIESGGEIYNMNSPGMTSSPARIYFFKRKYGLFHYM